MRRRRHGFTLTEMLMTLALLGVFGLVSSEVFGAMMRVVWAADRSASEASRIQSATDQLRRDVWSAASVAVPDPRTAELTLPDQTTVTWRTEPDCTLTRSETTGGVLPSTRQATTGQSTTTPSATRPSTTKRWPPAVIDPAKAVAVRFAPAGAGLVARTPATADGPGAQMQFVSQRILAEGGPR